MTFAAGYAVPSTKRLLAQAVARPEKNPALLLCRAINKIQALYAEQRDRSDAHKAEVIGTHTGA
jgi:hypothetical protein